MPKNIASEEIVGAAKSLMAKVDEATKRDNSENYFLPMDKIKEFSTSEVVRAVLGELGVSKPQTNKLAKYISTQPAKKTFLLLVWCDNVERMTALANFKFSDKDLPVQFNQQDLLVHRNGRATPVSFPGEKSANTGVRKDNLLFHSFQSRFLAPVFTTANFYHEIEATIPLPLLPIPNSSSKNGSFGSVRKVLLHKAHQQGILPVRNLSRPPVKESFN